MKPITVRIPEGSLLSPSAEAAVVGGNVLTSQRVTDVILRAFTAAAASQVCSDPTTWVQAGLHLTRADTVRVCGGAGLHEQPDVWGCGHGVLRNHCGRRW